MDDTIDNILLFVMKFLQFMQGLFLTLFAIKDIFGIQQMDLTFLQLLCITIGIFILPINIVIDDKSLINTIPITILIYFFKTAGVLFIIYGVELLFPQLILHNIVRDALIATLGIFLFLL